MKYKKRFHRKRVDSKKIRYLKLLHQTQIAIILSMCRTTISVVQATKYKKAGFTSKEIISEVGPELILSHNDFVNEIKNNDPNITHLHINTSKMEFAIKELKERLEGINK